MSPKPIRVGREPDPARRLRKTWGEALRDHRRLKHDADGSEWSLDRVAEEMTAIGYPISAAAIGMWERGETAPRWHHQAAIARVYGVPHHCLFAITDEVA